MIFSHFEIKRFICFSLFSVNKSICVFYPIIIFSKCKNEIFLLRFLFSTSRHIIFTTLKKDFFLSERCNFSLCNNSEEYLRYQLHNSTSIYIIIQIAFDFQEKFFSSIYYFKHKHNRKIFNAKEREKKSLNCAER